MAESIIINTGPLIALARIDALNIIERLPYDFLSSIILAPSAISGEPKIPMERRRTTLKRNLSLFFLFVLLAIACQVHLAITDRLYFDIYPIPLMIVVYLGYKLGRWAGLCAGIVSSAFWPIAAAFLGQAMTWDEMLWQGIRIEGLSEGGIHVIGHAVQHIVLIGLLGFISGVLFDLLDKMLARASLCLDELVPKRRSSLLGDAYLYLRRRFRIFISEKDGQQITVDSPKKRRWVIKLAILPISVILALLNLNFDIDIGPLQITLPPLYLSALIIIVYASITGSHAGMRLAGAFWSFSILLFLFLLFSTGEMGFPIMDGMVISLSVFTPAQLAGLAILVWWSGKAGEIFRDKDKMTKLAGLWGSYRAPEIVKKEPSYLLVFVLAPLSVGISFTAESFRLDYVPTLAIFIVTSVWSYYRDETAVSNRTLMILLAFAVVSYTHFFTASFSVRTVYLDFFDVLILAAAPLVIGKVELSSSLSGLMFLRYF